MKLFAVDEPSLGSASVARVEAPGPVFVGKGGVDLICGSCEHVVARGLESASQVANIVMECTNCGGLSSTRI
ncbi:hypothetical protein [Terrabacter sp. Ter38]|uniref:hypothetical protein n=1 Tax=Terrabacter sp. Ter38 TaxID=2926030 RepID=UPI0021175760|nr:hypothetical protein [Terrabacter sp. Ter38]